MLLGLLMETALQPGGGTAYARRTDPERALLRAVLLDAIRCMCGEGSPISHRARLEEEARRWAQSRSDSSPFSFENVCAWLGFPADRLRASLLQLADGPAAAKPGRAAEARRSSCVESRGRSERNRRIRELRACGWKPRDLAEEFGLCYEMILIICGQGEPDEQGNAGPAPHPAQAVTA